MSGSDKQQQHDKLEKEVSSLRTELKTCKDAKPLGEACNDIIGFVQKEGNEPFSTEVVIPTSQEEEAGGDTETTTVGNKWHKSQSKGGLCIIL